MLLRNRKKPLVRVFARDGKLDVKISDLDKVQEFKRIGSKCIYLKIGHEEKANASAL